MSNNPRPTVCIVDDEAPMRSALRLCLKSAGFPSVSFSSAQDFLDHFQPRGVAAIILDVHMPGMSGLELLEVLRQRYGGIPVVLLTGHATVPLAVEAMQAGAVDVLEKPFQNQQLLERVRKALAQHEERQAGAKERRVVYERLSRLTPREKQVLDLMVSGLKNKEIAQHLKISPKTLDIHRSKVMEKMEANTVADLVRWRLAAPDPAPNGNNG